MFGCSQKWFGNSQPTLWLQPKNPHQTLLATATGSWVSRCSQRAASLATAADPGYNRIFEKRENWLVLDYRRILDQAR